MGNVTAMIACQRRKKMIRKKSKKAHAQGIARYCAMTREELIGLCDYYTVNDRGSYLGFKDNGGNILAVAHIDHHCSGKVHSVSKDKVISSALDDRAGCYIAMNMLKEYGITADVLLTDDEEIGHSTIDMLGQANLYKYNWIVELDRRGTGCVLYGFGEMYQHVTKYFTVEMGSYSDIVELEEVSPVGAFNMGVGYHREHTEGCYLIMDELISQLKSLSKMYKDMGDTKVEREHTPCEVNDIKYVDYDDEFYNMYVDYDDDEFYNMHVDTEHEYDIDWRLDDPNERFDDPNDVEGMLWSKFERWVD
jgi:hypothetical protein